MLAAEPKAASASPFNMLPSSQRLSAEQFELVMKGGRVSHSSLFLMRAMKAKGGKKGVAAVIPMKIGKTAVIRNKFRRKIYAATAKVFGKILPETQAIVFAKADLLKAKQADIETDVKELFVKARLLE